MRRERPRWVVYVALLVVGAIEFVVIGELFGAVVVAAIIGFGVLAILIAAEGLHGYPRADRTDPMDERRDPPEGLT